MRLCDQRMNFPKGSVCQNPATYICSICKKDFCEDHIYWARGYALCETCSEEKKVEIPQTDLPILCQMTCTKDAVTTCENCDKALCAEHSYLTRMGRLCADCMESYKVPMLPPATRVRVPDSPTGGTRVAEVRPKGILRTARLITMNKLLTAGGSYLQPGGAILEIEGQEDLDLTEGQFKALFEEI